MFADRVHAGRALAAELHRFLRRHKSEGRPLVLALPRGGVPVAKEVADALRADLDVVVARKIGMPGHPEYGIGAVTPSGPAIFQQGALIFAGLREEDLAGEVEAERSEARRRLLAYRENRPPPRVTGRIVILVDDGLATGATAVAALRQIRALHPAQLIFAAPVCSRGGAEAIRTEADAVICAERPAEFWAVGRWYRDFRQTSDEEVEEILSRRRVRAGKDSP